MKKFLKKILFIASIFVSSSLAFAGTNFKDTIFDYQNNVKDFSDDGINENVVEGRFVQASPIDLKVGDIFIDVDGTAQKVISIIKKGNDITIDTIEPNIREVFLYLYSPDREIDITDDLMVSPVYDLKETEETNNGARTVVKTPKDIGKEKIDDVLETFLDDDDSLLMGLLEETMPEPTLDFSASLTLDGLTPKSISVGDQEYPPADWEAPGDDDDDDSEGGVQSKIEVAARYKNNGIKITPGFCLPYQTLNTHGTWKFWKWTIDYHAGYARVTENYDVQLGVGIGVEIEASKQWKWPLFTTTPSGTGVSFDVKWGPSVSGKIIGGVEFYSHIIKRTEVGCRLDGLLLYCIPTAFYSNTYQNDRYTGVYAYGGLSGEFAGHIIPIVAVKVAGINLSEVDFDVYDAWRGEIKFVTKKLHDPTIEKSNINEFNWYGKLTNYLGGSLTVGLINNAISKEVLSFEVPLFSLANKDEEKK